MTETIQHTASPDRDRLAAAERFMAAGRFDEAGALLDSILKVRPNDPDVLNAVGGLWLARGDAERAAAILGPSTTAYPNHPGLVTNLGIVHQLSGRLDEAQSCFLRAQALAPERDEPLHALSQTRLAAGDIDGAAETAVKILSRNKESVDAFGLLGLVALARDDRPAAVFFFRQVLARKPDDAGALRTLSACYLRDGETAEALALAERAQLAAPLDVDTVLHLGLCQAEAGHLKEAEATCRGLLAFAPNHVGLRELLARVMLADGRADTGLAEITQFAKANPRSAEAVIALAGVARQAGRLAQAGPLLEHALKIDPKSAIALAMKEEIAFSEGRFPPQADQEAKPGVRLVVPQDLPTGEFILLARFLPAVADASGTVKLKAADHFLSVAAHLPVPLDFAEPAKDEEVFPVMALPRCFTLEPEWLTDSKPYLVPDPDRARRWRQALEEHPRPWIGVAWNNGGPGLSMSQIRSAVPAGCTAVSLMAGAGRHDLRDWPEAVDAGTHCADFAEMIAAIANLDMVIGPDVAMLHLAGALGRPGAVAVACHRPWAWANREGRSLWYPTLQVVTQATPSDWDDVVEPLRERAACTVETGSR